MEDTKNMFAEEVQEILTEDSLSVIEVNICPQVSVVNVPPTHCPLTNVTMNASTLLGSPNYTYTWVQSGTSTFTTTSTGTSLNDQITVFVPINNVDRIYPDKLGQRVENVLKYHIVDYPILPVQLFNSINRIDTFLKPQFITIGGTDNELFILYPDNKSVKNKILATKKTDNGYIYYIDNPLTPYLY